MNIEKRTTVDFSKHIIIESHYQDGEYNLDVWDFKLSDSNYRHRIKFINSCGILAVKGDFGNWIFCREFHPSKDGFVSGGYWDEKLVINSEQEASKYSVEATRKAIYEFEKEHEDSEEDIKDWIEALKDSVEDETEYVFTAYRETPRDIDYEDVPFEKERHHYLNVIYDAFDEMCKKSRKIMKNKSIVDEILNKYTDNGKIKYSEIGNPEDFKKRYEWYKKHLKEQLPDFTEEEIVKFHKNFHKFKDTVYAFNGFDLALEILNQELNSKNNETV